MFGQGGELSVQARLDRRNWWILVRLEVGGLFFDLVLDTGSALSGISQPTLDALARAGLAMPAGQRYLLRQVRIDGQAVSDLHVRISPRVTQVGADGVLGLDFLARYEDIHFNVPTLRLTLSNPSAAP